MGLRKINVGVLGCGSFAKNMHLPNMKRDGRYRIHVACDIDLAQAEEVREKYGCAYATEDMERMLSDDAVDLVMITTRHDLHAQLCIWAAKAGKHILVEKPMGLNAEECLAVQRAVKEAGVKYCIGYNRGLAPFVAKAREVVAALGRPFVMYHRMQNYICDHWLLEEKIGGGRLVGEGCHIFDMACVLADAAPDRVFAEGGVLTGNAKLTVPDTGAITLGFPDGSAAALLVSSVGHHGLSKESTEIYCGNVAIQIDDFRTMKVCNADGVEETTLSAVDKGHRRELDLLARALLDDAPCPNNEDNALRAALISFKATSAIQTHKLQTMA